YDEQVLEGHGAFPTGKIEVVPCKPFTAQQDLALACLPANALDLGTAVASKRQIDLPAIRA
ncbi:MAG: hypothetical protein KJN79_00020, partial [Gammaproteobacteria bacterium]|nr:hypothetical protein [Gammaproteobacteria bacterium]